MKQIINSARQGEILIFRINPKDRNVRTMTGVLPLNHKLIPVVNGVIREGEKSGHKHELEGQYELFKMEDRNKDDGMILQVGKEGAEVKHPEHKTVKLPEGDYKIEVQREFDEKKHTKAKD